MSPEIFDPYIKRVLDNGRFVLLEKIGEGGMGKIYKAQQRGIERVRAVKIIREDLIRDPQVIGRFMVEVKNCSKLSHPNVVSIIDFGRESDGLLYLVMEYVEGRALSVVQDMESPLAIERIMSIAIQVCAALQEAHSYGIVHRDLKPDNIMICQAQGIGELVKILDFGIAKCIRSDFSFRTKTGLFFGTPAYMSPEQAKGEKVDQRSDLYSLGVVLYELIAGNPPFEGEPIPTLMKHVNEIPKHLSEVCPGRAPPVLENLVMSLLEKDPDKRPNSAADVRQVLQNLLAVEYQSRPNIISSSSISSRSQTQSSSQITLRERAISSSDIKVTKTPLFEVGGIIDRRFRIERIVSEGLCTIAEAVDLSSSNPPLRAIVRFIEVDQPSLRTEGEMVVERWLSIMRHFRHPSIASLIDYWWESRGLFIISEAVIYQNLAHYLLKRGRMEIRDALNHVAQICIAVQALHDVGVIHQDLRTKTVHLLPNGRAKIADPALWPLYEVKLPIFTSEESLAAKRYKSPEQLGLLQYPVCPETDLYAIGVILYELLTERSPFEGLDEQQLCREKIAHQIVRISTIIPECPKEVDTLVEKLLHPIPMERFRSAMGLRSAIDNILRGSSITTELTGFRDLDAEGRLIGRDSELSRLMGVVSGLERGEGNGVVIMGDAGVGKTRLIEEIMFDIRKKGGLVIRIKCREDAISIPFAPIRELYREIENVLDLLEPEDRSKCLKQFVENVGQLGALLKPFSKLMEGLFSQAPQPPDIPEEIKKRRLLQTLCIFPVSVSRFRPLVLVIDDLQWADSGTLVIIEYLMQTVSRNPLVLICISRTGDLSQQVSQTLEFLRNEGAIFITLGGLSLDAVETFLAERIGHVDGVKSLASRLHALSDGNPTALKELLWQMREIGALVREKGRWNIFEEKLSNLTPAEGVVGRMVSRIGLLSPATQHILQGASVWGAPFDVATLSKIMPEIPKDRLVAGIVEADRAGLLRVVGYGGSSGFRDFAHDAIREAVKNSINRERLSVLHRMMANQLSEIGGNQPDIQQRIAEHILFAEPKIEDAPTLEKAALSCLYSYNSEAAVKFASAALSLLENEKGYESRIFTLKHIIAKGMHHMRRLDEAVERYTELLKHNIPVYDRVEILKDLSVVHQLQGEFTKAYQDLEYALKLLDYQIVTGKIRGLLNTGKRLFTEIILKRSGKVSSNIQKNKPLKLIAELLLRESEILFFTDPVKGFRVFMDALYYGRLSGDLSIYARILAGACPMLGAGLGWLKTAKRMREAAERIAQQSNDPYAVAVALVYGLSVDIDLLDLQRLDKIKEIMDQVQAVGDPWLIGVLLDTLGELYYERGQLYLDAQAGIKVDELLVTGPMRQWFRAWAYSCAIQVACQAMRGELAEVAQAKSLSLRLSELDTITRTFALGHGAMIAFLQGKPEKAFSFTNDFLQFLKEKRPIKRFAALGLAVTFDGLIRVLLDSEIKKEGVEILLKVCDELERFGKGLPKYEMLARLARIKLKIALGDIREARKGIKKLMKMAQKMRLEEKNTVVGAEIFYYAGIIEGGMHSQAGKAFFERGLKQLSFADEEHWLKRALNLALDRPLKQSQGLLERAIHKLLGLPVHAVYDGMEGSRDKLHIERIATFINKVMGAWRDVGNKKGTIDSLMEAILVFTGADIAIISRYDSFLDKLEIVVTYPAPPKERTPTLIQLAIEKSRVAIKRGENIIGDYVVEHGTNLVGSIAAIPYLDQNKPLLVLFLENRRSGGIFEEQMINIVSSMMPIVHSTWQLTQQSTK